jgi:hypothetical protein
MSAFLSRVAGEGGLLAEERVVERAGTNRGAMSGEIDSTN